MVEILEFSLKSLQTFRGKTVKPAIVMADGESAKSGELKLCLLLGEGWQHIGESYQTNYFCNIFTTRY